MHIVENAGVSGLAVYFSGNPDAQTSSESGILLCRDLTGRLILSASSSVGMNITSREQFFSFKPHVRATAS